MARVLTLCFALLAQSTLALQFGPLAPHPVSVVVASRTTPIVLSDTAKYKKKSYLERLQGPSNKQKGRWAAQEKREAAAAAAKEAEAKAAAAEAAAAAAEEAEAAAAAAAAEEPAAEEPAADEPAAE